MDFEELSFNVCTQTQFLISLFYYCDLLSFIALFFQKS